MLNRLAFLLAIYLGIFAMACGIRGYHLAGGTGDVTHAIEPGARVIVPNKPGWVSWQAKAGVDRYMLYRKQDGPDKSAGNPYEDIKTYGDGPCIGEHPDPSCFHTGGLEPPYQIVASVCDPTLWSHVYHPKRLKIVQECVTVTGYLRDATKGRQKDGCRHEADGDGHCFLEVDPEFAWTLLPGNKEAESGYLVFEPVCRYKVTQKDAMSACVHYHQPLVLPPVGSHISLTGALIEDEDHQPIHREIHPASSIEVK